MEPGRSSASALSSLAATGIRSPISRRTSAFSGNRRSQGPQFRSSRCSSCSCSTQPMFYAHLIQAIDLRGQREHESAYLSGIKVQRIQFAVLHHLGHVVVSLAQSRSSRMMTLGTDALTGLQIDSVATVTVGGVSILAAKAISGILVALLSLPSSTVDSGPSARPPPSRIPSRGHRPRRVDRRCRPRLRLNKAVA